MMFVECLLKDAGFVYSAGALALLGAVIFGSEINKYDHISLSWGFAFDIIGGILLGGSAVCFFIEYCRRRQSRDAVPGALAACCSCREKTCVLIILPMVFAACFYSVYSKGCFNSACSTDWLVLHTAVAVRLVVVETISASVPGICRTVLTLELHPKNIFHEGLLL